MKTQSKIQKGKELEEWIVNRLRISDLDNRAYRQKGSGSGLNKGDIWNDLNIHFEAKNQKNFGGKQWFKQMEKDNVAFLKECLVWHMPQTPLEETKVIINWDWFEELLKKSKEPAMVSLDRELKWKLQKGVDILKSIIKELE